MERANRSREAVASATGRRSMTWQNDVDIDKARLLSLKDKTPSRDDTYKKLNHDRLENKLVDVHALQEEVQKLRSKYEAAIQTDDEERRQIREDMRRSTK